MHNVKNAKMNEKRWIRGIKKSDKLSQRLNGALKH